MDNVHTIHHTIDDTALDAACELPPSTRRACIKLATSSEQCKLLERCQKIKMGTRGVELIISRIIHEDIVACGEEITGEISDIGVYEAIMDRKIRSSEKKRRKWRGVFQKEKRVLVRVFGANNRKYRRLLRMAHSVIKEHSDQLYKKNCEKIKHLRMKFA